MEISIIFPTLDIEQHHKRERGDWRPGLDNQSEPEKLTALAGGYISGGLYRALFIIGDIITNLNLV